MWRKCQVTVSMLMESLSAISLLAQAEARLVPGVHAAVQHANPKRPSAIHHEPGHTPFLGELGRVGRIVTDKPDAIEPQHAAKQGAHPQIPLGSLRHIRDRAFRETLIRAPHFDQVILGSGVVWGGRKGDRRRA